MQRTPQQAPTLTQTKLTGFGVTHVPSSGATLPTCSKPPTVPPPTEMDTSVPLATPQAAAPLSQAQLSAPVTTEVLLRSLKENTEEIIKSFHEHLGAVSTRVGANTSKIVELEAYCTSNARRTEANESEVSALARRVEALEKGNVQAPMQKKVTLSNDYLLARRSVRVWPVPGETIEELWEGAGEFIQVNMAIPESDMNQEDIEEVRRAGTSGRPGIIKDEIIIVFKNKEKRDLLLVNSVNLSEMVGSDGRPTAGTRLEIPEELMDEFRLHTRFGMRLRARHGPGNKRHVKFDDFSGKLYSNIKLPGDVQWTRVTSQMARDDLNMSMAEENRANQKRLAAKPLPGPRERLQRAPTNATRTLAASEATNGL